MTTLTVQRLRDWMSANSGSSIVLPTNPSAEVLALMQTCIDATLATVATAYNLPTIYTDDIELALLIMSARNWEYRNSPSGVLGFGDFGAVRATSFDPMASALLEPYKAWRFSGAAGVYTSTSDNNYLEISS